MAEILPLLGMDQIMYLQVASLREGFTTVRADMRLPPKKDQAKHLRNAEWVREGEAARNTPFTGTQNT